MYNNKNVVVADNGAKGPYPLVSVFPSSLFDLSQFSKDHRTKDLFRRGSFLMTAKEKKHKRKIVRDICRHYAIIVSLYG